MPIKLGYKETKQKPHPVLPYQVERVKRKRTSEHEESITQNLLFGEHQRGFSYETK